MDLLSLIILLSLLTLVTAGLKYVPRALAYKNITTSDLTTFMTLFETSTITAPPSPISISGSPECGVIVNGVDVNLYYWSSIIRLTETTIEYGETCNPGDPNTLVGKMPPITASTNDSSPHSIPIYMSFVHKSIGETTNIYTWTDSPADEGNNTVPGVTSTVTDTDAILWSTNLDPADMTITAVGAAGETLTSATPIALYTLVEIMFGSRKADLRACKFTTITATLPFPIADEYNFNDSSAWIQTSRAPVSGPIAHWPANEQLFSSALNIGNFTLGTYKGYPTFAQVSYFSTAIGCASPVFALSSANSLFLPTSVAAPLAASPAPNPGSVPTPSIPLHTSAANLEPPLFSPNPSSISRSSSDIGPSTSSGNSPNIQSTTPSMIISETSVETSVVYSTTSAPDIAAIIASILGITLGADSSTTLNTPIPPSSIIVVPLATPASPLITVAGSILVPNTASAGGFIIGSQTLLPGSALTLAGTTISLASPATVLVVDGSTFPVACPTSNPTLRIPAPVLTVDGVALTAQLGAGGFLIASQTLRPGAAITVAGTVISLAPSATAVVIGGLTYPLTPLTTTGSQIQPPTPLITTTTSTMSSVLTFSSQSYTTTADSVSVLSIGSETLWQEPSRTGSMNSTGGEGGVLTGRASIGRKGAWQSAVLAVLVTSMTSRLLWQA